MQMILAFKNLILIQDSHILNLLKSKPLTCAQDECACIKHQIEPNFNFLVLQLKLINVEVFCVVFIEASPHTSLNLQSPESATLILVVLNVWLIRDEYLSYLVIENKV
jgi:hypothetical protein